MATAFNTQAGNGKYRLQFETDNKECYLLMQNIARRCVDGKPQTHGDQIRAMNDEELAKLIYEADSLGYCKNLMECVKEGALGDAIPDDRCIACALAWLRQPVEEGT